jgi:siroheme synthase (precorrin-2 oxidase/ferrochelatase)
MRDKFSDQPADHIVLVGAGEAAMAALWRLCAAGAHIRWYADSADVGEEAILAHALGGGHVELSFDDPLTASLDGATGVVIASGESRQAQLAERARASGVAVQFAGEAGLAGPALAQMMSVEAAAAAAPA